MIDRKELDARIAEIQYSRDQSPDDCIYLASLYTIRDHLFPRETEDETKSYSLASAPAAIPISAPSLMDTLHVVNPKVYDMDLSAQARDSAMATVSGYIEGLDSMLPQVQAAVSGLVAAAEAGLNSGSGGSSGSGESIAAGRQRVKSKGLSTPSRGYASGTVDAAPGWKLVGEYGPELEYFGGGESVMNARATRAFISAMNATPVSASVWHGGRSSQINMPVTVTVQGSATPETVSALRDWGDDFAQRVLDVIADAENDDRRTRL